MRASSHWIPPGDAGTMATVAVMRSLARQASLDPAFRQVAAHLASQYGSKHGTAQAAGLRRWLADHIIFVRDPEGHEYLHDPRVLLQVIGRQETAHVDCDDVATLGAALGLAVGLHARFVVVGFASPTAPYRHVWAELCAPHPGAPYVDLDITRSAQPTAPIARRVAVNL